MWKDAIDSVMLLHIKYFPRTKLICLNELWDDEHIKLMCSLSLFPPSRFCPGKLTQLRELNVNYNKLSSVPPELGECENLERLELTGNLNLRELPFEVRGA